MNDDAHNHVAITIDERFDADGWYVVSADVFGLEVVSLFKVEDGVLYGAALQKKGQMPELSDAELIALAGGEKVYIRHSRAALLKLFNLPHVQVRRVIEQ